MTMRIHGDKIEFPDGTEQFTASSGGGVKAQPPVAFKAIKTENQTISSTNATQITWQDVDYNDENGFSITDNSFVVPKDGIYHFDASVGESNEATEIIATMWIDVDGDRKAMSQTRQTKPHFNIYSVTAQLKLKAKEKVSVYFQTDSTSFTCKTNTASNSFSGHMISAITEGEVKEKEAVVFLADIQGTPTTVPNGAHTDIKFDNVTNGDSSFLTPEGQFKPNVAGWYQINVSLNTSTVTRAMAHIYTSSGIGNVRIFDHGVTSNMSYEASSGSAIVYLNGTTDYAYATLYQTNTGEEDRPIAKAAFSAHLITGQSTGGGTGGGSYTPEKMEWKKYPLGSDPVTQREFDQQYTNDTDVPRYIQLYLNSTTAAKNYINFKIDGIVHGSVGSETDTTATRTYDTNLYIIPSGSTYTVESSPTADFSAIIWHEARMPVAVGAGKPVVFKAGISANQTVVTGDMTKVNLDTAPTDTDNALVDGKFKPSVAGWYNVNGSIGDSSVPASYQTISAVYKNGDVHSYGTDVSARDFQSVAYRSNFSDVIYLNGTTDYLELWGVVKSTGSCAILGSSAQTFLSAVLVSGGSASGGDSIWTDVDGDAVLETDGKKLTIDANVGELGLKSRITTDASILELKAGSGDLADVSISDTEVTLGADSVTTTRLKGNVQCGHITTVASNISPTTLPNWTANFGASGGPNNNCGVVLGSYNGNSPYIASGRSSNGYYGNFSFYTSDIKRMGIDPSGRVDIIGSLYVNNTPKSLDVMITDLEKDGKLKDKLIEKLSARLDKLEKKLK